MRKYNNISWGFDSMDKTAGEICIGNVYVLAGKSCMGKTPFLLNILHHVAVKEKRRVLFLSSDNKAVQAEALGEILVMLNGEMAKYDLFRMNYEMWKKGYESVTGLQKAPYEIYSLKGCDHVDGLKEVCLRYPDLELLIVDNVNDLAKEIAVKYHFAVIAVCKAKERTGKQNKTPPKVEEIERYREIIPEMDSFISMCRTDTLVDQAEGSEVVEFLMCSDYRENQTYQSVQMSYIWDMEKDVAFLGQQVYNDNMWGV